MLQEFIKDDVAGAGMTRGIDLWQIPEVRKLICKGECVARNSLSDAFELLQRAPEIAFSRCSPYRRSVPPPLELKIKFNSILAFGANATRYRLSTHF